MCALMLCLGSMGHTYGVHKVRAFTKRTTGNIQILVYSIIWKKLINSGSAYSWCYSFLTIFVFRFRWLYGNFIYLTYHFSLSMSAKQVKGCSFRYDAPLTRQESDASPHVVSFHATFSIGLCDVWLQKSILFHNNIHLNSPCRVKIASVFASSPLFIYQSSISS